MAFPIGDYSTSARAVVNNMNAVLKSTLDNKLNTTAISSAAIQARAKQRNAVTNAKALREKTKDAVDTSLALNKRQAKTKEQVSDILLPSKRMAGVVGLLGQGAGLYMYKQARDQRDQRYEDFEKASARRHAETTAKLEGYEAKPFVVTPMEEAPLPTLLEPIPFIPNNTSGSNAPVQSSPDAPAEITQLQPTAYKGSYDFFTPEDKKWAAFGVSGEALLNTPDENAVLSTIAERMKRTGKPAKEIVFEPGQYAAVEKGTAFHDPELQSRLFSPEGLSLTEAAARVLNFDGNPTMSFKGEGMLHNRSRLGNPDRNNDGIPDLDIMFDPRGNMFHNRDASGKLLF